MIIFSKGSGLNDDMWKDTGTAVTTWLTDIDKEHSSDDALVKSMFSVEKSKQALEKSAGVAGLGNFQPTVEGGNAPLDMLQEGYSKTIEHSPFMKKLVITKEMNDDNHVQEIKNYSRAFLNSYKRSRAEFASLCMINGINSTFSFEGKTFDCTTGDGKTLFAADHPGIRDGVAAQSNRFTNAFGSDATMLYTLANMGKNLKDDSGHKCNYVYDTIYLPSNRPAMIDLVQRIIHSSQIVNSPNNDINTQEGKWKLCVVDYWDAATGKNPYIIGSSKFQKDFGCSVFYDRVPLTMRDNINNDNFNLEYSAYCRWSAGFREWRHLIYGGADSGTTIS